MWWTKWLRNRAANERDNEVSEPIDEALKLPVGADWSTEHWVLLQRIEREICHLYHQCSVERCWIPDMDYANLPYWEYLEIEVPGDEKRSRFVRDGCLVVIFYMCSEVIDGAAFLSRPRIAECLAGVSRLKPEDEQTVRLVESVKIALEIIDQRLWGSRELDTPVFWWIYQTYVEGYFRDTAERLDEWNRRYRGGGEQGM